VKGDNGKDIFCRKVGDDEGSAVKSSHFRLNFATRQIRPIMRSMRCGKDLGRIVAYGMWICVG
jgi:hypothetical protein